MKVFLYFLLGCVMVAVLQYAIVTLVVMICLLLVWGCLTRPQDMLGVITYLVALGLLQVHPWFCLAIAILGMMIWAFKKVGTNSAGADAGQKLLEYKPMMPSDPPSD